KMSKSLGNFITIRDFIKEYSPQILRLFVLKTHYRSPIDYRESKISQTKKELEKIKEFVSKIKKVKSKNRNKDFQISKFQKEFKKAMDDDFNTPKAIAVIFNLINKGNSLLGKNQISKKQAKEILNFLKETDQFFGFIFWKETIEIPSQVKKLAKEREKARKNKDWEKADEIRGKVKEMGFQIEDTKEGPKIKAI
ncbi:MAG TPA: DALR domain-containing protein, partial [Candidatus Parcubacteria bacterium]|nr:DALR domain-containing protein [Candidatus Parcubacteria bacterium]